MNIPAISRKVWTTSSGNEEMSNLDAKLLRQQVGHLKARKRADTVTEEGNRKIEKRFDCDCHCFHQRVHRVTSGLLETTASTRRLHGPHFETGRQVGLPAPINRCSTSRVGKTEQTQPGLRIRL